VLGVAVVASADTLISVKVKDVSGLRWGVVSVPIRITSALLTESDSIRSYQFHLTYDPTMLAPVAVSFQHTLAATAIGDSTSTSNIDLLRANPQAEPVLQVAAASAAPLFGNDSLAVIQFTVLGPSLSQTQLTLSDVLFNEGPELLGTVTNGVVTIQNRPPAIQPISPVTVMVGQTMNLTVRAEDLDGDVPVTFSIQFTQGAPKFGINAQTGAISYTPVLADTGTYVATITATDSKGASSTAQLTVTVDRERTPPVILGTPVVQGVTSSQATIFWQTNEPATSIVRYGPPGGALTTKSDPNLVTDHTVVLTGLRSNTTYQFDVQSLDALRNASLVVPGPQFTTQNRPPTIQLISPVTVIVGQRMDLTVRAEDPDGDVPITFSILFTQGAAKFGINAQTGAISYTPVLADTGTYVATITATDSKGASSTTPLTVTVEKDRTPPVIFGTPSVPSVSTTQATIFWQTNKPATSIVRYGLPGGALTTVTNPALVTDHTVVLTGLQSNTTYQFDVQSIDALNNISLVVAGPQFTTLQEVIILPPVITTAPFVDRGTDFAFVKWTTDRYATSVVRYGITAATYTDSITGAAGVQHNVALTRLTPSMWYYYSVRSVDAFGLAVAFRDTFFETKALLLPPRVTPPTITSKSQNSFTVTWNTDRAATSIVQYGPTSAYGNAIVKDTVVAVTNHSVTVTGLQPSTEYHYRVGSGGPENLGPATSGPMYSNDQSIFTLDVQDTRPPQWVTKPDVPNPGYESAIIVFETDEDARVVVDYGVYLVNQPFQYTNTVQRTTLAKTFQVQLLNLTLLTAYQYRVRVYDFYNKGPTEYVSVFITANVPDTQLPVILNNWVGTEVTDRSATVRWLTDEPADSRVIFEISGAPGTRDEAFDPTLVNEHNVSLQNLQAATRYSLTVSTADNSRNTTTYGTSITTKATPDTLPPVVVGDPVVTSQTLTDSNLVNVIVTAKTDELALATARYGPSETSLNGQVSTGGFNTTHQLTFTNLPPATTIYFQITYVDASERQNTRVGLLRRLNTITGKDVTSPIIKSGPTVVDVQPRSFTVGWVTDEASTSRLRLDPDPTKVVSATPVVDGTSVQDHRITATNLIPGTKYYWRAGSDDPSGNRVVSQVYFETTLLEKDTIPPVFTMFPAVLYTSDALAVLKWETDENTRGDVYLAAAGADVYDIIHDDMFKTRHGISLTNLEAGKGYLYFVEAVDATGNSSVAGDSSAPVFDGRTAIQKLADGRARIARPAQGRGGTFQTAAAPDETYPVITVQPKVVGSSTTSATVTWGTDETANSVVRFVPGASGKLGREAAVTPEYVVNSGTPVSQTDWVTSHQITVTGLQPNTAYIMMASSTDPVGNGETHSQFIYLTTSQTVDLTPPVIVSGSILALPTQTQAIIRWETDKVSDSRVSYGLAVDALTSSRIEPDPMQSHQVTLTNLLPDTVYYYTVSSTDIRGNGPTTSPIQSFTCFRTLKEADTTPPTVSGITLKRVTDKTATVAWATDEAAGTYIEYGTSVAFGLSVTEPTAVTSHEVMVTNLQSFQKYYFRIEATDRVGNSSEFTPTNSLMTAAAADTVGPNPPAVVDTIPASGRVILRWRKSASEDIGAYRVYRDGTVLGSGITDTTYQDRNVQNDVTYAYEVAGVDVGGIEGAKSAPVRETPSASESPSMPTPISPIAGVLQSDSLTIIVGNSVPPMSRPGDLLTYSFVLASDSLLQNVIAASSGVPQGSPTTSCKVAGYQLVPGDSYYWAAQSQGSVSTSPITPSVKFRWHPTAVQLAAFAASGDGGGAVRVTWELRVNGDALSAVTLLRGPDVGSASLVKLLGPEGINGEVRDVTVIPGTTPIYWLRVTDRAGSTEMFGPVRATSILPTAWALSPARPNPFNPTTEILLSVPSVDEANVMIYNILGQPVATLWSGPITPGIHRLWWDAVDHEGRAVASGIYIVRLRTASGVTKIQRVTMLR